MKQLSNLAIKLILFSLSLFLSLLILSEVEGSLFLPKKAFAQSDQSLCQAQSGYWNSTEKKCFEQIPVDISGECPSGYELTQLGLRNVCRKLLFESQDQKPLVQRENVTDQDICEAQGGHWDPAEGECIKQVPVDIDGNCLPGYEKVQLGLANVCRKILFRSIGQKIRVNVDDKSCPGSTPENPIINTALGCIPANPQPFISWIFKLGAFIGGGIAFLLMAWGTFLVITSTGEPEKLKQGKDIIVSAVSGLLFIIFAVFLLRLIGADILKIPGFEK